MTAGEAAGTETGAAAPVMPRRVLVTGADGFVGRHLVRRLASETAVRGVVRNLPVSESTARCGYARIGDLADEVDWQPLLDGVDVVIHLAALAHRRTAADAEFLRVNCDAAVRLAEAAAAAGVARLVFLSSVGVLGRSSGARHFAGADTPAPRGGYAESKWRAERALRAVAERSGLELVIVRPPLVYGHDAPGNWARLVGAVRRGLPLPLAGVDNRRSLIGIDNLCDVLWRTAWHPAAAGRSYLVCDGEAVSTPELVRRIAEAIGTRPRLFHLPPSLVHRLAGWLGREELADALLGSLLIDMHETCAELSWQPPLSLEEGLRRACLNLTGDGAPPKPR